MRLLNLKITKMRTKVRNKKINSQIKKPHLKRIPNKDNYKKNPTKIRTKVRNKKNVILKSFISKGFPIKN